MEFKIDSFINNLVKKIDKRYFIIFISCYIIGIIAHGARLFDYIYMQDGIWGISSSGDTIPSGRWALGIANRIIKFIGDGHNYQSPVFLGFLTFLFMSIFIYIIVLLLDIKSKVFIFMLSGLAISFPFFPSLFNFIFTAPFYTFAMALSVFAIYLFMENYKKNYYLIYSLLITFSIGIYQAVLPVAITLLILCTIKMSKDNQISYEYIFKSIAIIFISVGIYIMLTLLISNITNIKLSEYRGINNFGIDSLKNVLLKIRNSFCYFFAPMRHATIYKTFFAGKLILIYYFSLILQIIMIKINFYDMINKKYSKNTLSTRRIKFVIITLCFIVLPISLNLTFLMISIDDFIYTFMMLPFIFYIVLFIWNIDLLEGMKIKFKKLFELTMLTLLLFTLYTYCRFDNACYMANNIRFNRIKNYCSTIISQIKNTPGYKDELPVCYINKNGISDKTFKDYDGFKDLHIDASLTGVNMWYREQFMDIILGFAPNIVFENVFKDNEEVMNMPHYPDYGSIKIINDVVVIKF